MKIIAINTKNNFNVKPNKVNHTKPLRQNMGVDSFSFSGRKSQKELTQDQKIDKVLGFYSQIREIRIKEDKEKNDIKKVFDKKIEKLDKQIEELTKDPQFVAATVESKKERNAWGMVAHVHFEIGYENKQTLESASENAIAKASDMINNRRANDPQGFLSDAPKELKEPKINKKYQQLRDFYQQKVNLQNEQKMKLDKISFDYADKTFDIELKESGLFENEDYSLFISKLVNKACEQDKKLKQAWRTLYRKAYQKAQNSPINEDKKEISKMIADTKTEKYLKGEYLNIEDIKFN